jgi:Raf kinase inhibitor-like YbhB/YbcL family protein
MVTSSSRSETSAAVGTWRIESSAFAEGGEIPREHTCDGADRSPQLRWEGTPEGAQSLALIMHDPDAPSGDYTHWVLYDVSPGTSELDSDMPTAGELSTGARQGQNDFGRLGYGGPCPPPGPAHRYIFDLYALDTSLGLPGGAARADVERVMRDHVLGQTTLTGTYARRGG